MPHSLIVGMTTSGKSAIAKLIAQRWKARGVRVAVLDPMRSPEWPADFLTPDPDQFLLFAKTNRDLALFVDEGAKALERDADYNWLTTRARWWGHESHIISQRPADITPAIRGNCETVFVFRIDPSACQLLAKEWAEPALVSAAKNPKLVFHLARRFSDEGVRVGKIDFARRGFHFLKGKACAA